MSRPDSRLGKATHGQYRIFPMNVNGTMLMSEAMPLGNDPYKRLSRQAPTSDTRRLSAGMEAAQVSCDVGRYHAEHRGSATPDPGAATSDLRGAPISVTMRGALPSFLATAPRGWT